MIAWFINFALINGISLGLEHVTGTEEDEGMIWMIVFHFFIFRVVFGQMVIDEDEDEAEDQTL